MSPKIGCNQPSPANREPLSSVFFTSRIPLPVDVDLSQAMKQKEFRDHIDEYTREVSDPAHRQETGPSSRPAQPRPRPVPGVVIPVKEGLWGFPFCTPEAGRGNSSLPSLSCPMDPTLPNGSSENHRFRWKAVVPSVDRSTWTT